MTLLPVCLYAVAHFVHEKTRPNSSADPGAQVHLEPPRPRNNKGFSENHPKKNALTPFFNVGGLPTKVGFRLLDLYAPSGMRELWCLFPQSCVM